MTELCLDGEYGSNDELRDRLLDIAMLNELVNFEFLEQTGDAEIYFRNRSIQEFLVAYWLCLHSERLQTCRQISKLINSESRYFYLGSPYHGGDSKHSEFFEFFCGMPSQLRPNYHALATSLFLAKEIDGQSVDRHFEEIFQVWSDLLVAAGFLNEKNRRHNDILVATVRLQEYARNCLRQISADKKTTWLQRLGTGNNEHFSAIWSTYTEGNTDEIVRNRLVDFLSEYLSLIGIYNQKNNDDETCSKWKSAGRYKLGDEFGRKAGTNCDVFFRSPSVTTELVQRFVGSEASKAGKMRCTYRLAFCVSIWMHGFISSKEIWDVALHNKWVGGLETMDFQIRFRSGDIESCEPVNKDKVPWYWVGEGDLVRSPAWQVPQRPQSYLGCLQPMRIMPVEEAQPEPEQNDE